MKRIVTSSSDFKHFINKNAYYVDKTPQIEEFFDLDDDIILMPRPRRFGKTMFLSTIKYLCSNREAEKELFKETAIYETEFFNEYFGKYPVIHITFKDVKEDNFELMMEKISSQLNILVKTLLEEIDLKDVKSNYKEYLENIIENKASQIDYENSLKALTEVLTEYYKAPCVVLIDEYDSPVIYAYTKGYYEKAIGFFRNLLSAAFKENDLNIKKALITGILRVSGESMFSGLNNITTLTILENDLSTSCGFTIEETKELFNYYNISKELQKEAFDFYNCYIFGDTEIVNPFSILKFVKYKTFEAYWANTASNDFIYYLIQNSNDFKANLEKLLRNEEIDIEVNKNITFRNRDIFQKDNVFSLLFFSGYLKCKEKYIKFVNRKQYLHCKMIPTNIECQMIFEKVISKYVDDNFQNQNINDILEALTRGDLETFEELLSYLLLEATSYHDLKTENSYHMFLLGILTNLNNEYEIISNSEAGYGRVDIVLLHKEDKTKPAIIMELKKINKFKEETKDEALQKAVNQIREKNYIELAKKRGYKNIIAFGLVFDGKRCWIKEVK